MSSHDWERGQWRDESSSHSDQNILIETNNADEVDTQNSWASPPECFNERGLGPDAAASRSLKFLKRDFISSQVVPSRAEKFPVLNTDANLYKNYTQKSLYEAKNKNLLPNLKPETPQRSSDDSSRRSSTSWRNLSFEHTASQLCCSSLSLSILGCDECFSNLISAQELLERKNLNHSGARAGDSALSNNSPNLLQRQSDKLLSSQRSGHSSQNCNVCSIVPSTSPNLGRQELSEGVPSLLSSSLMNQVQKGKKGEGTHAESQYLACKASLSSVPSEDCSSPEVVWQTIPTSRKLALQSVFPWICFCKRDTGANIIPPYDTIKLCESSVLTSSSNSSNNDVVWIRSPGLLPKRPSEPHIGASMPCHSNSGGNPSFHRSQHIKSVKDNQGRNLIHFHRRVNPIDKQENLYLNSARSSCHRPSRCRNHTLCRSGSTSRRTSSGFHAPLRNTTLSESASHSLCPTKTSNAANKGHISATAAQRQGARRVVSPNGIQVRVLPQILTYINRYDARRVNRNLDKGAEYPGACFGGTLPGKARTPDPSFFASSRNSSRMGVEKNRIKNLPRINKYSSRPYTNHIGVDNMRNLIPSKRAASAGSAGVATNHPKLSKSLPRIRGNLADPSQMVRSLKKNKFKRLNQVAFELLRTVYLDASGLRAHRPSLPGGASSRMSSSQMRRARAYKNKAYLEYCGGNTKESGKENTGKMADRIQSLIKSKDPFSYLLGLHGFWGETNYY